MMCSPGFIDLQLNGAYGFDFSVYEDEGSYKRGMQMVAERIIETGVTSYVSMVSCSIVAYLSTFLCSLLPTVIVCYFA